MQSSGTCADGEAKIEMIEKKKKEIINVHWLTYMYK
jgi:hypothetical protein